MGTDRNREAPIRPTHSPQVCSSFAVAVPCSDTPYLTHFFCSVNVTSTGDTLKTVFLACQLGLAAGYLHQVIRGI